MSRLLKVLLLLTIFSALAAPAWARPCLAPPPPYTPAYAAIPGPVPYGMAPAWARVPSSPEVFFAPNLPTDLFLVQNKYYYYYGGVWYLSKRLTGAWCQVTKKLPRPLYRVSGSFFKSPPPW
jgi:hypothetical protein